MNVLVIPDIHLKPWMFDRASELMKETNAERAICLMDIADDWHQEYNLELYEETYDKAIAFAGEYPETLWCYGNHDVCYLWNQRETGYSWFASGKVCEKLKALRETLPDERQLAYIHRIDNVLFSHGGLMDEFVRCNFPEDRHDSVDEVLKGINQFGRQEMWKDLSPIWARPQYYKGRRYQADKLLQVVGHTPVEKIVREKNVISCDVFSTDSQGNPIGTQEYLFLDTLTWEHSGRK